MLTLNLIFLLKRNTELLNVALKKSMATGCKDQIPLFSFGIIADVHYADLEDGTNFAKTQKRCYRQSLSFVEKAVLDWKAKDSPNEKISFVLDVGDVIDEHNNFDRKASETALETIIRAYDASGVPIYHIWGNHEFYNFTRKELFENAKMNPFVVGRTEKSLSERPPDCASYFHFSPFPGYRLIILDTYEISMLGRDEKDESYRTAEKILRAKNKNEELNSFRDLPLCDVRFVKFNGGVSEQQIKWLDDVLSTSHDHKEIVLMASHIPIYSCSTDSVCLCWNAEEILEVLHKYSCVVAFFAGHTHNRIHAQDEGGIHHLTLAGVIKPLPKADAAHGTVVVYRDRIVFEDAGARETIIFKVENDGHSYPKEIHPQIKS